MCVDLNAVQKTSGGAPAASPTQEATPVIDLAEAMNRMFRDTLPPLFAGLALLLSFLAVVNFFVFPDEGYPVLFTEMAVSVIFLALFFVSRRVQLPLWSVHPLGVLAAWLLLISNLVHLAQTANPWKSMETILIVVGVGSLLLSRLWLGIALAGVITAWYAVASRFLTAPELKTVGYSLLTASALSVLIQIARIRIYKRLESLRLRDEQRKQTLQEALAAAEHEILERQKAGAALRESESRYRQLVDMAPVAIVVHAAGVTRFVNRAALSLMGVRSTEELVGKPILDFVHPEDHPIAIERIRRVLEEKLPSTLGELRMIRSDGQAVEVEVAGSPVLFEGEPASQVVLLDLSERKRTDARLRVMQFAIDHAGEALLWMNTKAQIVYANIQACELLDYTMEELLGLNLGDLDPRFVEESSVFGDRSLGQGKTVTLEREFRRRDGSFFPAEITVNRLSHEQVDLYIIFMRDITERKRTEAALRDNEERFRKIFEEGPLGMAIINPDMTFVRVNSMLCRMLGYSEVELIGRGYRELIPSEIASVERDAVRRLSEGETPSVEVEAKWLRSDGSEVWVRANATLIRDQQGHPIYGLAMVEDVTRSRIAESEKARLEDQLRQAQKMEAVGTLAGGVAHDFNNLLAGILGYANILKTESAPGTKVRKAAEIIERAGERARDLTGQLLGFARKGKNQNIAIDLNGTIRDVATLLRRTIPKNIHIHHRLDTQPVIVQGDPNQLEQVFLNFALNARDAMPQGGTLTFSSEPVAFTEEDARLNPGLAPGQYIRVNVTDTGVGIPREFQERIFEPFFTTKELGQGTGMGLAMVYGIVRNHGGVVRVYSEVGHGTTFRVYLPLVDHQTEDREPEETESTLSGSGRILVVDDEEVVRTLLDDMLTALGYDVVLASNGREAVDYYRMFGGDVDLVILDMVMPEMDGRECFLAIKAMNPEVRAILSTGYSRDGAAQEILNEGMVGFVQKPFRVNHLSQVVHRALREPASPAGGVGS
jgi:PAS domain S-box-containing protein